MGCTKIDLLSATNQKLRNGSISPYNSLLLESVYSEILVLTDIGVAEFWSKISSLPQLYTIISNALSGYKNWLEHCEKNTAQLELLREFF